MQIDPAWSVVLEAIVGAPRAWSTAAELAALTEIDMAELVYTLADLNVNGLVDPWGDAWTLSPLAQSALNVHIIDDGFVGRERWERIAREPRHRRREARTTTPFEEIDQAPGPVENAIANEEAQTWKPKRRPGELPKPTILLTGCALVWTETVGDGALCGRKDERGWMALERRRAAAREINRRLAEQARSSARPSRGLPPLPTAARAPQSCSACHDSPLPRMTYCLRDQRWGFDDVITAIRRRDARAEAARSKEAS